MYREAWLRELHHELIPKAHEIDALVLTTQLQYNQAKKSGKLTRIGKSNRDPFWMVPEPKLEGNNVQNS